MNQDRILLLLSVSSGNQLLYKNFYLFVIVGFGLDIIYICTFCV